MKIKKILRGKTAPLFLATAILTLASFASSIANAADLQRYEFETEKMGSPLRVILYAPDDATAKDAVEAVWKRFDELNDALSDWNPESEIIRVSRESDATGGRVALGADLRRALEESRFYCELTEGAFDPTVGPVVKLWRRSRYFHERPPREALERASAVVGLGAWDIDADGLRADKNARFDVGGIAKGIALDEALAVLKEKGIRSALVDASGDLRIGDPPPNKSGWRVGVSSLSDAPAFYLETSNVGIASSGDANRYVEIDGARYSHIIDPRTCEPLTRRCVSTVLAPTATCADALASALCVLGAKDGPRVLERAREQEEWSPFEYILIQVSNETAIAPYSRSDLEITGSSGFLREFNAANVAICR